MADSSGVDGTQVDSSSTSGLKRRSGDIGWKYGKIADPSNKDKVKCNFCQHVSSGGVNRFKQHIAGIGSSVAKCTKCPKEARDECLEYFSSFQKKKKEKHEREQVLREDVNVSSDAQHEEEMSYFDSSRPTRLGPMDKWTRPIDPTMTSSSPTLHQQKINQALWKERTLQVHQYIAKWVYTHG